MQVKTALSETAEHRSFLRVEEGNISRTLAFDCGRGYAQEECVMKREREREREKVFWVAIKALKYTTSIYTLRRGRATGNLGDEWAGCGDEMTLGYIRYIGLQTMWSLMSRGWLRSGQRH